MGSLVPPAPQLSAYALILRTRGPDIIQRLCLALTHNKYTISINHTPTLLTHRIITSSANMKSVQRQFGKLSKRSEDKADVSAVLAEFKAADDMLEKVSLD